MSYTKRISAVSLLLFICMASASAAEPIRIDVPARASSAMIRLVSPDGSISEHQYAQAADAASIDIHGLLGAAAVDGAWNYEVTFGQPLSEAARQAATVARAAGSSAATAGLPEPLESVSGGFSVVAGKIVDPALTESKVAPRGKSSASSIDQVIAGDLIVQGSACIGIDCVANEDFGFDTLRLKENNLRIKFDDTSTGAFPATDWQLTANDSTSGGLNRFSIEDITAGNIPFTVVGNAPSNALYLAGDGKIGLRTTTPALDLQISTSNTPGIRIEQTNAGGFTAQTWDMAGNEANFFIRDVTGGSRLPFRIRPGAPTSAIDIAASGNVGIGTASPSAKLDVNGDAYIAGTLTQLSSRTSKTNFVAVTAEGVLDQLARLPIWTWNYLRSNSGDRHIGPVAEDFYATFGFGTSERHLAPSDVAGVALAATQALQREVAVRDAKIEALEARLERLEKAMAGREPSSETSISGH